MLRKRLRFKSISVVSAIVVTLLMSVSVANSTVVRGVTTGDYFEANPPGGIGFPTTFPATLALGTDGVSGGVAVCPIPGIPDFQSLGTPDITPIGFSTLFGTPIPSAWPTSTPILFGVGFEFNVVSTSGDIATLIMNGGAVPHKVTVESNGLAFDSIGTVPFEFSTTVSLAESISDTDGWIPGTGSFNGTPFTGWAAGLAADVDNNKGLFSVISTDDLGLTPGTFELTGVNNATFTAEPIPEPSTLLLFGFGALGFIGYGWRRWSNNRKEQK
jgi:hypothetical protein